ncbi:hypothetical protein Gotur_012410 [Gossypium turneri]
MVPTSLLCCLVQQVSAVSLHLHHAGQLKISWRFQQQWRPN